MYHIEIVADAIEEMKSVPAFHRRLIATAIESKLPFEPARQTKNMKRLEGLVAGFEHEPPLWELRVGDWRVFYDVDDEERRVVVRAIRRKPKGKTTGEVV